MDSPTHADLRVVVDDLLPRIATVPDGAWDRPAHHLEWTCRETVQPHLDQGYDTVGTHVNVAHLAAAPIGMAVTFKAEVTGVTDRRVQFRVEAWDEKEKVGEGTHERAVINVAKFATRLAEKMK